MTFSKQNLTITKNPCYFDKSAADVQVIRGPSSSNSDVVVSPLLLDEQDVVLLDDDDDEEEQSSLSSSDSCTPRPVGLFDLFFVIDDVC